ncbi:MAG: peptide-modifying radical SAM enzyme CbpB [Candidatus Omnitrophica bacterium]|nr:peptide-modifying radical SAM enzyme CbpB [Candidatus Omnitrophota bacterium]
MKTQTYFNTGEGESIQPLDIGHRDYACLVSADTAFWALVKKDRLASALAGSPLLTEYRKKAKSFSDELDTLRFKLKPSAVYFNPTDRCNLNCSYCYIPAGLRKSGTHMSAPRLLKALGVLKNYFKADLSQGQRPQVIFHGAEPLLNKQAVFAAIDRYKKDFRFGIQTNGTLLDGDTLEFLTSRGISIGLSLDGHINSVADRLRRGWNGKGVSRKVVEVIGRLKGYHNYSVICTVTRENMSSQADIVEFFHHLEVPVCMLNPVRCTLPGGYRQKPPDEEAAKHYLDALDRAYELYQKSGRKLIVANFANVLVSILAPTARRLMCDISPCGAGRCFFAISSKGDMFPCSEFIGIKKFKGGNIFRDDIRAALKTSPFKSVSERRIEAIKPCLRCAIRHFCGAPCPAEAWAINGSLASRGAFCGFYEEQVRYAFRLIADNKEDAYLWDGWDKDTLTTFDFTRK